MPSVLDGVPWPKLFLAFALPLGLSNLDFLSALSKAGCGINVRYYDRFLLHMALPLGCVLVVASVYFVARASFVSKTDRDMTHLNQTVSKASILMALLLYPGLSTQIFTMFKCKTIPGVAGQFLAEDFRERCGEGEHVLYQTLAATFLCLYVLGIPAGMFFLLWYNKKHLHDKSSKHHVLIANALGGMYSGYEPSYWWFEIFLLFNKTLMVSALFGCCF